MQRDGWKKLGARVCQNVSHQSLIFATPFHAVDRT
jgi:hypothetical protein